MKKLPHLLLALLAAAFFAYAGVETHLRLTHVPPQDPASYPFSALPFQVAEIVTTRDVPGLPATRTVATWNGWGIRGEPVDPADPEQLRVVVLGGSVTECLLLPDDLTWAARLQDKLEDATGRDVWVGNLGQSGHQTLDYSVKVRLEVPHLRPHLVVIMPGGNDLQAACEDRLLPLDLDQPGVLARYAARLYPLGDRPAQIIAGLEPSYSLALARRERMHEDLTDLYVGGRQARAAAGAPRAAVADLPDHLETYRANLGQLADDLTRLPGARAVLMTHPALWKPDMTADELAVLWAGYTCMSCKTREYHSVPALRAGLDAFNAATLKLCRQRGLSCLDLAPSVEPTLDHFYDDAHLTAAGAEAVATTLAAFIVDQELLP